MTKSGTGTWDLGREDSGTPRRGNRGCGTRGRRESWDSGTQGRGTRGCEDVINKKHPNDPLNLQFTVFVI